MTVPFPDPVLVQLLVGLPGLDDVADRVGTKLDATLPAIRLTKVSDREPPTAWEATPIYQLEVWADGEFQAGSLAWAIKNNWPAAAKQVVGDALVTGRWVDADPRPLPDPETDLPRYLVDVGIRLSGATP